MCIIKMESKPNCIVHVGEPEYPVKSELGPSQATSRVRKLSIAAWSLETLLIVLTIGFGFSIKKEFSRSIVAVVTHALFSFVTTGFVLWNKSLLTRRSVIKNIVKFWISNVLFLSKPLSFWSTREKGASYEEKRAELCDLETKLKGSYTRLLVSFFTIIPACIVQYYYLLQAGIRIFINPLAIDVLRIATITTGLFSTAVCVYEYDELTIEYELQSKIEATNSSVEFRTGFWRYFMFICQRVTLTSYLILASPFLAIIYTISNFASNYVILKHIPKLENPYVNAPQGIHSTQSFWTFRIINIISGVGTRLNLDLVFRYNCTLLWTNPFPSSLVLLVFICHIPQLLFFGLMFIISHLGNSVNCFVLCVYGATIVADMAIDLSSFPFLLILWIGSIIFKRS